MMKKYFYSILFCLVVLLPFSSYAQIKKFHDVIPDRPSSPSLVNDLGNMLTDEEEQTLEKKLYDFEQTSSNEIAVVTVDTLGGLAPSEFANELGRKWDIGKEKKKNGVLVLIAKNDRKLNISPGYGLQGSLPDVICSRIIKDYIVPNFRAGNVYDGIDQGTDAIIAATKGEFTNDESPSNGGLGITVFLVIIGLILFVVIMAYSKRRNIYVSRRGYKYDDNTWGNFPRSGTGWFGSGGWGDGGGGGGGFGGFGGGGGGFDGGGSSGSW